MPDWSLLHEGSCLGRGLRGADGRWVFTGEGYDPSHNPAPAAPPPEGEGGTPHHRAEDLASFPPQFPLESGGGPLSALRKRVSPRFDDPQFELRYRGHRGKGLDSVQLWFASMATLYVVALWIYHAVDPNVEEGHRFDRQVRVTLILLHVALGVAWLAGAVLWRWPAARTRGSELQAVQVSVLVALFCWGLPATAREMCSDTYNTFDGNLQQTLFVLICYAAIFCRVGTGAFVALCALTLGSFIVARSMWSQLDDQPFAVAFEGPKLIATLSIVAAGVRRTDLHLRRDFAARELIES